MWSIVYYAFCCTGVYYFVEYVIKRKVRILCYHDPQPEIFERHLRILHSRYKIISIDDFLDIIKNRSKRIPQRAVVITFDDGHAGNYRLKEILHKYDISAVLYIATDPVINGKAFWWKNIDDKYKVEELKRKKNHERLLLMQCITDNGCHEKYNNQSISISQIMELPEKVILASHTVTHPILTKCNREEAFHELNQSKRDIEVNFFVKVKHFCFPNGDWNSELIDLCRMAGYESARTTCLGFNDHNTDPYKLKIVGVSDNGSENRFKMDLIGFPLLLIKIVAFFKKR